MVLGDPGGLHRIHESLPVHGETFLAGVRGNGDRQGQQDTALLALKREKGAANRGVWAASRSWRDKRQTLP